VRRADDHGLDTVVGVQQVHPQALVIDRDGDGGEPGRRQHVPQPVPAGIFDRHRLVTLHPERAAQQADRVGRPRSDHQVGRLRLRAADPGQVLRQHLTQPRVADDVWIGEVVHSHARRAGAHRGHPPPHGKRSQVGQAGGQIHEGARGDPASLGRPRWPRPASLLQVADPGARPHGRGEVPLGGQLGVCLGNNPAGAAKLVRERAGRRQRARGREPAGADRLAERVGQPRVQRPGA
jgi:hypothetical protein